jgi:hypothetical protein
MLINGSSAPIWLAIILAPRSRLTRWLVERASLLFVGLGVTYDALLASGVARSGKLIDFRDPDAVRGALSSPDFFLAGWAHYIAFDLFVGRWIWEDSLARARAARIALLLTWLAGPAGLSLYLVQRGR